MTYLLAILITESIVAVLVAIFTMLRVTVWLRENPRKR